MYSLCRRIKAPYKMLQKATEFFEIGEICKMHGINGMRKGFWWTSCKKETI